MRKILFKAKVIDWKEQRGEDTWVVGYYAQLGSGDNIHHFICQNMAECKLFENEVSNMRFNDVEIDPETLCQYTGATDKNNKEIWENDIMREERKGLKANNYRVVWDELEGSWMLETVNGARYGIGTCNSKNYQVIGNYFDNPECFS